MAGKTTQRQSTMKRAWNVTAAWIAGVSAVLAFVGTLTGFFHNIGDRLHHRASRKAQVALGGQQAAHNDYSAALATYTAVLRSDPDNTPTRQAQLAIAEAWIRTLPESLGASSDPRKQAAENLDRIVPVLEAALHSADGGVAADVQAHLGWAHWINRFMAGRELGLAAEQNWQEALQLDPGNVYAHAMLGHWLIRNHHNLGNALQHFTSAEATGRERPFVRRLELSALVNDDEPGARAATMRIADAMRLNHESLDTDAKFALLAFCCNPASTFRQNRVESFSALPADAAMQTYLWLEAGSHEDPDIQALQRRFVQALLFELSGNRTAALQQLRNLQPLAQNVSGSTLGDDVRSEIATLSR